MTQTENYQMARTRAEAQYGFLVHAAIYAGVILLLTLIDLTTSPGVIWFIWPMLGWGIPVALHGARVFQLGDKAAIIDALTARELRRLSSKENPVEPQ